MPLKGVRVVELAQIIAGPLAGQILAELGADVVKVERPEGDEARRWTPPVWFGAGPTFHGVNRSKRSVSLDLTRAEGRDGLLKLVREADVFVQNLRPGVTEKLGLDPAVLLAENPRLVYCDMGAFGHKGPKRLDPGFEVLFQAFSGLMDNTGDPDGPPMRLGASVCDLATGLWTALGAMAGLRLPIESRPLQALVSEPLKPCLDTVVMSNAVHCYISQSDKGDLVIGAGADAYNGYGQRGSFHVVEHALQAVCELFPAFGRVRMNRQWGGIVDVCPDACPIIGKTPVRGLYFNCGWGTGGFKATPGSGYVFADTVANDRPHPLAAPFSLERFHSGALIDEHGAAGVAH